MTQRRAKKLHVKYSESGRLLFTETQTKKRFALCREALSNNKKYTTRFKDIYESQEEIERYAVKEFAMPMQLTRNYFELHQRAWGGIYFNENKIASVEGAFFPFVRTRFNSYEPIDEGCVWIGNMSSYPLIYVHNNVAKWACPYSKTGFVRKEPFLPFAEAKKILPRLMNKAIYPDLEVEIF